MCVCAYICVYLEGFVCVSMDVCLHMSLCVFWESCMLTGMYVSVCASVCVCTCNTSPESSGVYCGPGSELSLSQQQPLSPPAQCTWRQCCHCPIVQRINRGPRGRDTSPGLISSSLHNKYPALVISVNTTLARFPRRPECPLTILGCTLVRLALRAERAQRFTEAGTRSHCRWPADKITSETALGRAAGRALAGTRQRWV